MSAPNTSRKTAPQTNRKRTDNDLLNANRLLGLAIDATKTIRRQLEPNITRAIGTPFPPFANPNLVGDHLPGDVVGQRDLDDLIEILKNYSIYPLDFCPQTFSIGEEADEDAFEQYMKSIQGTLKARYSELKDKSAPTEGNMHWDLMNLLTCLIYKHLWKKFKEESPSRPGMTLIAREDIALEFSPHSQFLEYSKNQALWHTKHLGYLNEILTIFMASENPKAHELKDGSSDSAKVQDRIFELLKYSFCAKLGKNLIFDFAWLAVIYGLYRLECFLDEEWMNTAKILKNDRLFCWKRQDPLSLCESNKEKAQFGFFELEPDPPKFLEDYGGEAYTEHSPEICFPLYPANITPRVRSEATATTCLNYVRNLSTGKRTNQQLPNGIANQEIPYTEPEMSKYLNHQINTKSHIYGKQVSFRKVVERERAVVAVLSFARWLSSLGIRSKQSSLEITQTILDTDVLETDQLAEIECLEDLYYGFLHCPNIAIEEEIVQNYGFFAVIPIKANTDTGTVRIEEIKEYLGELENAVPEATHRPVDHPESFIKGWFPPASLAIAKDVEAKNPGLSKGELEVKQKAALKDAAEAIFSRPDADEKNDSVDMIGSQEVSFVDEYELLGDLMEEFSKVGQRDRKRIVVDDYRYSGILDENRIKICCKIAGEGFNPILFDEQEIQGELAHAMVLDQMAQIKQKRGKEERTKVRKALQGAIEKHTRNSTLAEGNQLKIAKSLAEMYDLLKTLSVMKMSAKNSTALMRAAIDKRFFAPKRMTKKAMCKLISGTISKDLQNKENNLTYGLPHYDVAVTHFVPTNLNPHQYAAVVAVGCKRKYILEEIGLLGGIATADDIGDDDAAEFMDRLEAEESDPEDQQQIPVPEDEQPDKIVAYLAARSQAGNGLSTGPLIFSARYTYEVLFHLAQVRNKIVYPMGKTYPNLGWVYANVVMIDPDQTTGLIASKNELLYSVGGLALFDRYYSILNSTAPRLAVMVSQAKLGSTSDQNAQFISKACKTAVTVGILCRYASQIKGDLLRTKSELRYSMKKFISLEKMCLSDPYLKLRFQRESRKFAEFITKVDQFPTKKEVEDMVLDKFNLQNTRRRKVSEVLFFANMGFCTFVSDLIRAIDQLQKMISPGPNSEVYWAMRLVIQYNNRTEHDTDTGFGRHVFWFSALRGLLQSQKLEKARHKLLGDAETCGNLRRAIDNLLLRAAREVSQIESYRPRGGETNVMLLQSALFTSEEIKFEQDIQKHVRETPSTNATSRLSLGKSTHFSQ